MIEKYKMQDLVEFTLSKEASQRTFAETQITQMRTSNLLDFIENIMKVLINTELPQSVRYTAGLILKNSILTNSTEQNMQINTLYNNFTIQKKTEYRKELIKNFNFDDNVGSISATIIGIFGLLDSENNSWPTFFSDMHELLSSNNKVVTNALMAVSVNCHHAKKIKHPDIVYNILCYHLRRDANTNVLLTNLKCLVEIQNKIVPLLKTKTEELYHKLIVLSELDSEIVEFVLININELLLHTIDFCNILKMSKFMKTFMHKGEDLKLCSVEFFSIIADFEIKNNKDYFGSILYEIINDLFIAIRKDSDYIEEHWDSHKAVVRCISLLAERHNLIKDKNIQNYILSKFSSNGTKEEGINILGAILSCSFYSDETLQTENVHVSNYIYDNETSYFIRDTVGFLIDEIRRDESTIKNSALVTLGRLCETNFQNVDPAKDLPEIIDVCEVLIQMKVKESVSAANVICFLCNSMRSLVQLDKDTNNLTFYYCALIDILVSTSDTLDYKDHDLRNAIYNALIEAIHVCGIETRLLLDKLWTYYTKKIYEALHYSNQVNEDQFNIIEDFINSYLYILQAIYQKRGEVGMKEKRDEFLNILVSILNIERQTILYEDVYLIISSFCIDSKSFFVNKVNYYISFMIRDLSSNFKGVLTSDITLIGEIVCALGPGSLAYSNKLISGLVGCLTSSTITREVKPLIINTFGDMALSLGLSFENYVDMCFSFLPQVINIKRSVDEDFVDDLRGSVLNMIKCFILGMENSERVRINIRSLNEVVKIICAEDINQKNVLSSISICGDFILTFGRIEQFEWMVGFVRQYIDNEKYRDMASRVITNIYDASEQN